MYVVLVTGGIGSGKQTACEYLGSKGATVLDLDGIAKEEQENPLVLAQLQEVFGDDIVDSEGQIIRPLLADRAFASQEMTDKLNAICWPPVIARVSDYLVGGSCQPMTRSDLLGIEIPLLAEASAMMDLQDEIICVVAPRQTRLERAVARGMRPEDVCNRMERQATDEQRLQISDTVIDNSGTLAALHAQLDGWYNERMAARLF
jgi:dephospho-CoA kinase